jgi:Super-infection exclusion protein B
MTEFWTAIVSSIRKFGPIPLIAFGVVSGFLLFTSKSWLSRFGVDGFVEQYRPFVGIAVLVTWALLGANLIWWLRELGVQKLKRHRTRSIRITSLNELTPDEKAFLLPYIRDDVTSRTVPLGNGVVGGLVSSEILHRTASAAPYGDFPYNLQPWARRHLKEHPELLAGASVTQEPHASGRERRRRW